MSKLLYRKADGPDAHHAERRKSLAKLALGWAIIIGGGIGFLYVLALCAGASFLNLLGLAAAVLAVTLMLTYGIKLVVEHD